MSSLLQGLAAVPRDVLLTDVTLDSRQVQPGGAFLACRGLSRHGLEFAAEVRARTESRLGFRVGGKLVRRNADLGDAVKAGQVLAQLDPQDLRLGQDVARAGLAAAEANHEQAAADYKRFKELREQGFISSAELERRETSLKAAKATLDQEASDVTEFLAWAAEPHMEDRKRTGVRVILFLLALAGLMYAVKRMVWADKH